MTCVGFLNDQMMGLLWRSSFHGTTAGASCTGLHPLTPTWWWRPALRCILVLFLVNRSLLGLEPWSGHRYLSGSLLGSGMVGVFLGFDLRKNANSG